MLAAVLFDLDGVLVSTDEFHYRGWKRLADELGIAFTRADNERCRGVSRMESLEIVLEGAERAYSDADKQAFAERKNAYYRELLADMGPDDVLPGGRALLAGLRACDVRIAIASSSRNAGTIIDRVGLRDAVDALVDGNDISRSKPDPEVFLRAAAAVATEAPHCLVVEDAVAGIEAGRAAGMPVLGIGTDESLPGVAHRVVSVAEVDADRLITIHADQVQGGPPPTARGL